MDAMGLVPPILSESKKLPASALRQKKHKSQATENYKAGVWKHPKHNHQEQSAWS